MMAWRKWMAPLLIGVALGTGLTLAVIPVQHKDTLAVVLLVVQIPILIWDVWATLRVLRRDRGELKELNDSLLALAAAEQQRKQGPPNRGLWN